MKAARLNSTLLMRKGAASPLSPLAPYSPPPPRRPDGAHGEPAKRTPGPEAPTRGATPKRQSTGQPNRGPAADRGKALRQDPLGRVRVSLRLDQERHLRLRLIAAHTRRTIQETLLAALDAHLADHGLDDHSACLAEGGDGRVVELPGALTRPDPSGGGSK